MPTRQRRTSPRTWSTGSTTSVPWPRHGRRRSGFGQVSGMSWRWWCGPGSTRRQRRGRWAFPWAQCDPGCHVPGRTCERRVIPRPHGNATAGADRYRAATQPWPGPDRRHVMSADRRRDENAVADVARLLPTPPGRDLPASRNHALKELVLSEITPTRGTVHDHAPRRRRLRRAVLLPALGAVVAATAVGVVVGVNRPAPAPAPALPGTTADSPAVRLLARVAAVADKRPSPA